MDASQPQLHHAVAQTGEPCAGRGIGCGVPAAVLPRRCGGATAGPPLRLLRARWRSRREAALASAFAALRRFLASAFATFASAVSVGTAFCELMPTAAAPGAAPPR